MRSHFRTDRVGMEIKREVNVILQRKSVTRVFKASPLRMFKCWVICLWPKCIIQL